MERFGIKAQVIGEEFVPDIKGCCLYFRQTVAMKEDIYIYIYIIYIHIIRICFNYIISGFCTCIVLHIYIFAAYSRGIACQGKKMQVISAFAPIRRPGCGSGWTEAKLDRIRNRVVFARSACFDSIVLAVIASRTGSRKAGVGRTDTWRCFFIGR